NVLPVTRLRSRTCTNARRLPGVRCVNSITREGWPSRMMTWPRRMSVAFILTGSYGSRKISRLSAESTGCHQVGSGQRPREISHELPLPPRLRAGPRGRGAETVAVVGKPHVTGRRFREGVLRQQRHHLRAPLQQPADEGEEPVPRAVGGERREPHLPVEPGLVGRHEPRPPGHVARLPAKAVFAPCHAVATALDHDL